MVCLPMKLFPLEGEAIPRCRATSIRHVRQKASRIVTIDEFGVSTRDKILATIEQAEYPRNNGC